MAIFIRGKSKCSICQELLRDGEEVVSTPHFIADDTHPLWKYSDSAMHRVCFLKWDHREDFRSLFNSTVSDLYGNPEIRRRMTPDGTIEDI